MIYVPEKCLRGFSCCRPLAQIEADDGSSFFCCGENDGSDRPIEQDKYTVCFKGPHRDCRDYYDKRDLIHHSSVMLQAVAAVQADVEDDQDWSPWSDRNEESP